jgi:hypothetical protein
MNTFYRFGLLFSLGLASITAVCQQPAPANYTVIGTSTVKVALPVPSQEQPGVPAVVHVLPAESSDTVVLSGTATTARIADPNEPVLFSGRVMRMADFVAAVSSSNAAGQRPRSPEKRNREKDQLAPPSKPSD